MGNRLRKSVALLAFAAFSTTVLADEPPARVGRVALAQGRVSISQDTGLPAAGAQVNWPVTSHNTITTAPGARTELRIGSTSVRLDGDSALEVTELDDDSLRLRLHFGSVSVRIVNPDVMKGFELVTPEARVRMQQPGRLRVDAGRVLDTSTIEVFDGVAAVAGGAGEITLRAGRRVDVQDDDVRTAQAQRDAFDDWSLGRDQYEDRSQSARYIATEVTGYEDLDRYGSWRNDAEYGSLWMPTVGADWVPYRDGSWTWIEPWGWTWVDNAPWGYAPFHYGRWVYVKQRWCWAPGRIDRHPVWAPALVGWVGGAGWSTTFRGRDKRPLPATGWYPLTPHDRYVPNYRAPESHLRWWNNNVRADGHHQDRHGPAGVTVVPHDAFGHRDRVDIQRAPKGAPPVALQQAPGSAPPPPPRQGRERFAHERDGHGAQVPVLSAPPVEARQVPARSPRTSATASPMPASAPVLQGEQGQGFQSPHARQDGREAFEEGRHRRGRDADVFPLRRPDQPAPAGTSIASPPMQNNAPPAGTSIASPPMQNNAPAAGTSIASPPMQHNAPAAGTAIGSSPAMPAPSERFPPRFERPHRGDGGSEHRRHEDPAPPQAVAAPAPARQAMPAAQPAPMPAPQPAPRPAPQPAPMAAPAAAASAGAAPQRGGDQGGDRGGRERHNGRDGNARQQDR